MGDLSAMRLDDEHPQRRTARLKLFEPAEMRHGTKVQRVHLLDLSVAGALLHTIEPPEAGSTVMLVCPTFTRMAKVAWAKERRIGLSFVRALDKAELADAISSPPAR